MGKPLSSDLRQRLILAVEQGSTASAAARRFGVARSTAINWAALWRSTGRIEARPMGGDRHSHRMEAWARTILGWIEETPDITLVEMQARLRAKGAPSATGTLWRLLNRHAMTVKKRPDMLKNKRARI
jgi:transposase